MWTTRLTGAAETALSPQARSRRIMLLSGMRPSTGESARKSAYAMERPGMCANKLLQALQHLRHKR